MLRSENVDRVQQAIARGHLALAPLAGPHPREPDDGTVDLRHPDRHVLPPLVQHVMPHPVPTRDVLLREVVRGEQVRVGLLPRRDVKVGDDRRVRRAGSSDREGRAPIVARETAIAAG